MASAVNRIPKNLSFRPIQVGLMERIGSLPQQTDKINKTNLMDEEGQGIMGAIHDVMYSMLPSGPSLEKLTQAVLDHVAENLQQLPHDKAEVGLYDLCKVIMGRSTISALYGKRTPLDHPSFIPDYWDFDDGLLGILLSPFPSITHSQPYSARERMTNLLLKYFEGGHDSKASEMMRSRFDLYRKHGYCNEGLARTELCFIVGAVSNSTITAFWFLSHILSDAAIVSELRAEIAAAVTRDGDQCTVDAAVLRSTTSCPLLNSTFRETLRLTSTTTGSRQVLDDTMVGDRYLLKKGAVMSVEGSVLHYKDSFWGPDAGEFNARRFYSSLTGSRADGKKVHPAAWRAFGGGEVLCPGRNLALNEILGIAVPILLSFDVTSIHGGAVETPPVKDEVMPVGVLRPSSDVCVMFSKRPEWGNIKWEYRA
ncbi:putative cytochrome p450 protein [Neofusicoccum parvum]|nr:putative cytochrome p450 protein [Neofusicoccum parvum]